MRPLIAALALCLLAAGARAETITTTDGRSYTRAADGHLYPSAHVTATGAVSSAPVAGRTPLAAPATCAGGACAPTHLPAYPFPQACPTGRCPLPR